MILWTHPTPHPNRYLDQLNRFYTAQHMLSIYCTIKRDMYPQYHNLHGISTVHLFLHSSRLYICNRQTTLFGAGGVRHDSLGQPDFTTHIASRQFIRLCMAHRCIQQTNTQRPRYINNNRPHSMPCIATRLKNVKKTKKNSNGILCDINNGNKKARKKYNIHTTPHFFAHTHTRKKYVTKCN